MLENYAIVTLRDLDDYTRWSDKETIFIITKEALKQADEIDKHWYEYAEDETYKFSFDIEKYLVADKTDLSKYNVLYMFLRKHDVSSLSRLYEC